MKSIREFFARIQSKQLQELQLQADIASIISKHTKIELGPDAISFSPKILILKGLNQSAKSAVFIKKLAILADLNNVMPARKLADVRLI